MSKSDPLAAFYSAEAYQQDYAVTQPTLNIALYDLPKLDDLKRLVPDLYRGVAVTAMAATSSNK